MSGMGLGGDEAGTYEITVNQETTTIEADSIEYGDELRVWKGGFVVATFRWWDSVVKKK